jgi:peptide/nickel transport system substrate-binding protein
MQRKRACTAVIVAMAALLSFPAGYSAAQPAGGGGALAGSGLVGKLEGPELVLESSKWPKTFRESPELAELVKAKKLPPVAQRIPQEPLVLKPLNETGKYGGTWRRGFLGPGDWENGNRLNASDKLLFWDYTGTKIVPSAAKSWSQSADGKTIRLNLRKGMKWSDGAPFTADDFVFWFEDMYSNKDLVPAPIADMSAGGKPGKVVKIDETTVEFQFENPHWLFVDLLAGDTLIGGGQSVRQSQGVTYGAYAPKHYLKQFLPKYSSEAAVNAKAKAEGFENWVKMLHFKKDWSFNTELPTIGPWKTVRPDQHADVGARAQSVLLGRRYRGQPAALYRSRRAHARRDSEVINLRAIGGNYDMQERHITLSKLPVILENQKKGGYTVHLDTALHGSDTTLQGQSDLQRGPGGREVADQRGLPPGAVNGHRPQPAERDVLARGRDAGLGAPSVSMAQSPGAEWRTKWSTYDPAKANQMLDAIGLSKKDSEGYRVRTDNGERLRIQVQAVKALLPWPQQAEMIAQQWKKIGIQADVRELERTLAVTRTRNNEHQIMIWTNGGTELLYLFPRHAIPVDTTEAYMGPEYAKWYVSNGAQGKEPTDPNMKKIFDLYRSAAGQKEQADRDKTAQEIWKILVDQQYGIATVGESPAQFGVRLVSDKLGNIPSRSCIAQHCRTPGTSHPETWYFKQ